MGRLEDIKNSMAAAADTAKETLFNWHPKEYPAPPAPPAKPNNLDHMKTWVDGVMTMINKATAHGYNLVANDQAWKLHLVIQKFPPEYLEYYQKLQEEIALKIPTEEERPTITLEIRGRNRLDEKPFYGYVGGTGPLSDAATLITVRNAYDDRQGKNSAAQNMAVNLISAPPPRTDSDRKHMAKYGWRVAKFAADSGAQNIILLSNTAHKNLSIIKFGLQFRRAWKGDLRNIIASLFNASDAVINNMVKAVITNIQDGDKDGQGPIPSFNKKDHKILILGSEEGQNKNLYGSQFDAKGMPAVYPDADGKALQALIDAIKAGDTNTFLNDGKTAGEKVVDFMLNHYNQGTTHMLLACTELPMCLHTPLPRLLQNKYKLNPDATYQDLFNQQFKTKHPDMALPIIIDTEKKFAEYSVTKMLANEAKFDKTPPTPEEKTTLRGLECGNSDDSPHFNMPKSAADKTAIPVPRSFYATEYAFKELDSFADKNLIVYRPTYEKVTIDFTNQTAAQKGEMAIAAIEAALKLGVRQPIELTGEDFEAVKAGAQYCVNKGIGFYVADNMAGCLPDGLRSREPTNPMIDIPEETALMNIASLTGDNNPSPPAKRLRM